MKRMSAESEARLLAFIERTKGPYPKLSDCAKHAAGTCGVQVGLGHRCHAPEGTCAETTQTNFLGHTKRVVIHRCKCGNGYPAEVGA